MIPAPAVDSLPGLRAIPESHEAIDSLLVALLPFVCVFKRQFVVLFNIHLG